MRHTSIKDYEKALSGGEPTWKEGKGSLASALNWYNYHSDSKESKKFTISYLKELKAPKTDIELIEKVSDAHFQNLGFVCRMKLRGAPLTEKNQEWIDSFISKLKNSAKNISSVEDTQTAGNVISIQERVEIKSRDYIGEFESAIDDCILVKDFTLIDPYEKMQTLGVKGAHTPHIIRFFQKRIDELNEAIKGKDSDLKEGYSNFSKAEIKNYLKLLNDIISDANKLSHNAKLTRKPRKVKAKPVDKVVSKMQFKKEDNGFKLASIDPTNIVGATQLWIFNTKTRKLGVYNSIDAGGLGVKGTTITNFNEATSIQKTIRKPEVVLPNALKGGKVILKKLLPDINAVEQRLTGRINSDTILLRIIK
jgi:hypothetical protein